jgi:glycosyltransferase involved in cell wall biosynthesis
MVIDVLTPALNEEGSIARVIEDVPKGLIRHFIVCDNGSTDATARVAAAAGAKVVFELEKGYGAACLKGLSLIQSWPESEWPDILVFIDSDYSDFPQEMSRLVEPILKGQADLVIGSRVLGKAEKGSLTPVQRFGNWLSTTLIRWIYGYRFTDLGPFRAIRFESFRQLGMKDRNYGWTVEMQVLAAKKRLAACEVPVSYRQRIGQSKVSGTIKGSILAGIKILYTIFRLL